jgi:hypothetical protein
MFLHSKLICCCPSFLLQDQLGPAIAAACPDAAHFVLSSQALIRGSISTDAAASLSSVLLHGADLQAFDVVAALTDAGVSPGGPDFQRCSCPQPGESYTSHA